MAEDPLDPGPVPCGPAGSPDGPHGSLVGSQGFLTVKVTAAEAEAAMAAVPG